MLAASMPAPSADEIKSAILESITDACLALDRDWRFTYVNRHAEAILGRARGELLGKDAWRAIPGLAGTEFERALRDAVDERRTSSFEAILPGTGTWFEGSAYPSSEGVSLYFHDVSARKRMEQELHAHARELARSNEELERFAYVASHDLQEPLRMVVSYVQLLERKYKGHIDEQADRYIRYAVDGAKRMQRLINDLLAYSRVRRGDSEPAAVSCAALVDAAVESLGAALQESGGEVVRGDLPVVRGDASQLGQVFQNLVGNALKFRRPGHPPRVVVRAERDGGMWRFAVQDNGIGIAPEFTERVFVVFQRLHTREEYEGTGIGLAIAKRIVERHGGRMWVESTLGEGSTFHFTLPDGGAQRP